MRLLDIFKTGGGKPYITEKKFKHNLTRQVGLVPSTLKRLRQYGVARDNELKLEFFFHSKSPDKIEALTAKLDQLNYHVEFGKAAACKNLFVIAGWTTNMKMDDQTLIHWTNKMCELGYKFDCDFDGFETPVLSRVNVAIPSYA